MDLTALAPTIAGWLHISTSTFLMLLIIIPMVAKAIGRAIPDDATGFAGFLRRICNVVGVDVANRITAGVTTDEAARAAAVTPPVSETVKAETGVDPIAKIPTK